MGEEYLWEGRSAGRSTTRSQTSTLFEGEGRLLKQASHFAYRKLMVKQWASKTCNLFRKNCRKTTGEAMLRVLPRQSRSNLFCNKLGLL